MTDDVRRRIAHAVQGSLRNQHLSGKRARVEPQAIVEESSTGEFDPTEGFKMWYYVPVCIAAYDRELGTFYELFSRVEEDLESQGLDVLLVPVRRETPAGEYDSVR